MELRKELEEEHWRDWSPRNRECLDDIEGRR